MRPLLTALLGGWIAGTLLIAFVATQNFRMVDRLLAAPVSEFSRAIAPLGHDEARGVLRYLVSEVNRLYFTGWGLVQLALSVATVAATLGLRPLDRTAVSAAVTIFMIAVVLLLLNRLLLPLGRSLDFVPRTPPPPAYARFWRLHQVYTALDVSKLVLCLWLLVRAARR